MKTDFEKAKQLLGQGGYTCVLCKGSRVYTSTDRGVAPLLGWLELPEKPEGFCAADKVVGKAAAFLYLLMGVTQLYAMVISQPALSLLQRSGIACEYDSLVPAIRNRTGEGFCPMERAVWELDDPARALEAICGTLRKLKENNR